MTNYIKIQNVDIGNLEIEKYLQQKQENLKEQRNIILKSCFFHQFQKINISKYEQKISLIMNNREQQINNLYSNITQPLKNKEVSSYSNINNEIVNQNYRQQNPIISYDESYCGKTKSLINYQKQIINNPRSIINSEVLEDQVYKDQSVCNHISALKKFINNLNQKEIKLNELKQFLKIQKKQIKMKRKEKKRFNIQSSLQILYRPKKKLQIKLHQIHSQNLSKIFPFLPQ